MALGQEVRYAVRTLRNNPGFAAIAVLTLALGIGANTAMFSVVHGVLLRPLDYPNASRIVALQTAWPQRNKTTWRATGGDLVDLRAQAGDLEQLAFYQGGMLGVQLASHAEFVGTYLVTPNFLSIFGQAPVAGRLLEDGDVRRGAVVGMPFAVRNFGSAAGALGKTLHMDAVAYEIVGVLPAGFSFPPEAQLWLAYSPQPQNLNRTAFNYRAIGLLKSGVSLDAANAQLRTVGSRLESQYQDSNRGKTFQVMPLEEQLVGPVRSMLYFLMAAVSLVLLIACANVANLMLARATSRSREMAVRSALGASRLDIVRQLLVESAVVALAGGLLGILLAYAGTTALLTLTNQGTLPRSADVQVDWAVMLFAIAASLGASFLFGLSPAWQASRVDLQEALKQGGRGAVAGGPAHLRNALVVAQVALSFVLAIGAGLLFRSFMALNEVDLGYRSQGMLVMQAHHPARTLEENLKAGQFFATLTAELSHLPGVISAGAAMGVPAGPYGSNGSYVVDGQDFHSRNLPQAIFSLSGPGYFSTMGIPLVRGRDFSAADTYDAPLVAVISESLAKQSFGNQDPVGHTIECGLDSLKWMTVVGVVADVRQESPASSPGPTLYMPLLQHPFYGNELQVVMRTAVTPTSLIDTVRSRVGAENPQVAMRFTTMDAMLSRSIATPRLRMTLVALFAGLALLLAMAGMYGVMSYVTTQRIPEFGVRMALGASPRDVVLLVLRRAAQMAAVGIAIGLGLAFSAARVMNSMLFGLKSTDATTYVLVLIAVMPIVTLAASVPAWRAARVDPQSALRNE
ncbi:MAG TPA: ABC transporter permease [Terriglobales bacterium]|nr:ABC transporter permease [Terriglobales bacterium]